MSEKNRDDKNRWRNVTIVFRISLEENEDKTQRVSNQAGLYYPECSSSEGGYHRQSVDVGAISEEPATDRA